jgi:hypothetical protein
MITSTTFAGTTALTYRCWELVHGDGQPVEHGDGTPHFRTEEEARAAAPQYALTVPWRTETDAPVPRQLGALCFVAMARCGYVLDQANTMEMHHTSAEEAYRCALDSEFIDQQDGTLRCSVDCEDCAAPVGGVSNDH